MVLSVLLATIVPLIFLIIISSGNARVLIIYFSLGVIGFGIAYLANNIAASRVPSTTLYTTSAPMIEEFLKALPLVYFLCRKSYRVSFIAICGFSLGIGFSIQENYLYLINSSVANKSFELLDLLAIGRGLSVSVMHGSATAMVALIWTYFYKNKNVFFLVLVMIGALLIAIAFHSFFNLMVGFQGGIKTLVFIYPMVCYIVLLFLVKGER